ncbi:MAG: hypothetical protein JOZ16_03335 [Methylobacteriaceae bacterium]|nr:hypothetical protein [Methylobacteriaceae bacterium]
MRPSSGLSLPTTPSGLGAHQLRRAMELSAEAVNGRPRQPTYEELWGTRWRQPHHEPFRAQERSTFWFSPVLATLLAVIVGSMSLAGLKEQAVRAVPATAALYAAAGMPVNIRGLEFRGVTSRVSAENTQRLLKVRGEIANLRPGVNAVPPIEIVVQGEDGRALYRWTASAAKPKLGENETIAFETRLVAPPEAGRNVKIRFAQAN